MDEAGIAFITLAVVFALLAFALFALGLRRYQLRRALGTFDASMRQRSARWRMGVCRYTDRHLEWLRLFSLSPRPRRRFVRSSLVMQGWRNPTESERVKIQPGAIIVMLTYRGEELLLAMNHEAYTGLCSWLEAGPVIGIGTWR
ncbi:DUF2550 domain-containing protein [Arthrobacter castelli]|uniref:DUF2550 domain-containing protein n=1 Tax=Arthrobacter castelli TaxID=271431 RepID=UPI00041009F9|nr:DUF2550 domain-containing protein [Arthrobacter castelli]